MKAVHGGGAYKVLVLVVGFKSAWDVGHDGLLYGGVGRAGAA